MAKATPKKKLADKQAPKTLLNFFSKSPANLHSTSAPDEEDIKPVLRRSSSSRKGKEKAIDYGTAGDPVVISDDDEPMRPLKVPSPIPIEVECGSETAAGPSRSPQRSCSPPPANEEVTHGEENTETVPTSSAPNPFPNLPGFKPPASWPQIVNTAEDELEEDIDGDGSVIAVSDDEVDEEPEETAIDEMPALEPPAPPRVPLVGHRDPGLDLGLEWDEPEDEGMGMEEEDDDSTVIQTPPPVALKKRKTDTAKVADCPVCGKSLKGKNDATVQHHINTCLDTPGSSKKGHRPITSMSHAFSPAPSPSPPPEEVTKGPNAFSVLMSGHKEKEQWKDAEVDLNRNGKRVFGRRKAPFYKVLAGMPVAIDAFRYGAIPKVTAYLLTHAHSDHYTNLSKSWKEGPIYCSETTANLIKHMLGVEPQWVHGLPNNVPFVMPNTGGVTVTPIEANHCPGSSIFLFEGLQTVNAGDSPIRSPYVGSKRVFRYLHCGDFRACPKMVLHPDISRAKIDTCYLDTTYLNPKYCFPPQPQVIEACAQLARKTALGISDLAPTLDDLKPDVKVDTRFDAKPDVNAIKEENEEKEKAMMSGWLVKKEEDDRLNVKLEEGAEGERLVEVKPKIKGRTLVVMGTYSIGKERIVKAVARALGSKIYCDPRKKGILLCQTDPELHSMISTDPVESQVHLVPLSNIQLDRLQEYLARLHPNFDRVLGFRPTGWSYSPPAGTDMLPDVNMVIRRDQARTFSDSSLKPMRGSCRQFMMYGVPYSEHSSFFELTCFALSLPGPDLRMIATVNVGNEKSRAKMKKWFEKWQAEKARRKEKGLPSIVDYRDETYW